MSPSPGPALVLRPALCRRGMPLGVGMLVFSNIMRRAAMDVAMLLPSPLLLELLSASTSRTALDRDAEWE